MLFRSDYFNTLLYFYSTVPQVLGAMLAIIGAVQQFKLQAIRERILGTSQKIVDMRDDFRYFDLITGNDKPQRQRIRSNIKGLHEGQLEKDFNSLQKWAETIKKTIKDYTIPSKQPESRITVNCNKIIEGFKLISSNRRIIKQVFWINGFIIFLFISAFILIPRVYIVDSWYLILIVLGILLAGFSLYTMITYITNIVLEREQPNLIGFKLDFRKLWNTIFEKLKLKEKKKP